MNTERRQDNLHKIVVLNPKGGCGKTTLATNLASYFAMRGPPPTLVDCDSGGYSMRWIDRRPADRPCVYGYADYEYSSPDHRHLNPWPGSKQLIVDLPAAMDSDRLISEVYDADSVLIPVVPSEIDVYSAAKFIAELLLVTQFDRRERKLAIVANRTRHYTKSYKMLMRFLTSLEIPIAAQLRDSQNYVHAAAQGIGICEMPHYKAAKDIEQFHALVTWLDGLRVPRLDELIAREFRRTTDIEIEATDLTEARA